MKILLFLLLCLPVCAQEGGQDLPDAPKAQKECFWCTRNYETGKYDVHLAKWNSPFHDPLWKWTHIGGFLAAELDIEVTHAGIAHHRCVERSGDGARLALYGNTMGPLLGMYAFDWMVARSHLPKKIPVPEIAPSYSMVVHTKGAADWLTQCW
jgi:hypothetical protein